MRIFVTGSSDGLGILTAKALIADGHEVVLHARNEERKEDTLKNIQGSETVLIGDLSSIEETKTLAELVNLQGVFDCVIHNAGVYNTSAEQIFAVNVLAPYLLTSLIQKPKRLIYLSSDMHRQGELKTDVQSINYSDSKLHVLMLCNAVARKWKGVYANAVDPGWVPTKMGGSNAPDDLKKGYETQAWLATSNEEQAKVSGGYFFHKKAGHPNSDAHNILFQDRLMEFCNTLTGVSL